MLKPELKYTKEHEWINNDGVIGITDYAQRELGDVVFVELPKLGSIVEKGKEIAVLESVKAVSNVYSPVSGKITEINDKLSSNSELINKSPYEEGWIAKVELLDPKELDELLSDTAYQTFIDELHTKH